MKSTNRKLSYVLFNLVFMLSIVFSNSVFADSSDSSQTMGRINVIENSSNGTSNVAVPSAEMFPITFTWSGGTLSSPTCPVPTAYDGVELSNASQPMYINATATSGSSGTYYDGNFNAHTATTTPAYFTCYYIISYMKTSSVPSASAAAANLFAKASSSMITTAGNGSTCPSFLNATSSQTGAYGCILGAANVIFASDTGSSSSGYNSSSINTSLCYNDSAVQNVLTYAHPTCTSGSPYICVESTSVTGSGPTVTLNGGGNTITVPPCSGSPLLFALTQTIAMSGYDNNGNPLYGFNYTQNLQGQGNLSSAAFSGTSMTGSFVNVGNNTSNTQYPFGTGAQLVMGSKNVITLGAPTGLSSNMTYQSSGCQNGDGDPTPGTDICGNGTEQYEAIVSVSLSTNGTYP